MNFGSAHAPLYLILQWAHRTHSFRVFKNDAVIPPIGIQLTVINAEFDFFWKYKYVLLESETFKMEYDALKKEYERRDMDEAAKNNFFNRLIDTIGYNRL